jgi:hypothetical protein
LDITIALTDQYARPLLCTSPWDITLEFRPVLTGRKDLRFDRPTGLANVPSS